ILSSFTFSGLRRVNRMRVMQCWSVSMLVTPPTCSRIDRAISRSFSANAVPPLENDRRQYHKYPILGSFNRGFPPFSLYSVRSHFWVTYCNILSNCLFLEGNCVQTMER